MKKLTSYMGVISLATLLTCSSALAQAAATDQNTAQENKAQAQAAKGQPASTPQASNPPATPQGQPAKDEQARKEATTEQTTTRDITKGTGNSNPGRVSEKQPRGMSDNWAEGTDTRNRTRDVAGVPNSNPGRIPVARDTNSALLKNQTSSTRTPSDSVARSSDRTTAPNANPGRAVQGRVQGTSADTSTSPNSP